MTKQEVITAMEELMNAYNEHIIVIADRLQDPPNVYATSLKRLRRAQAESRRIIETEGE